MTFKDFANRAFHTAWQAAAGSFVVSQVVAALLNKNLTALESIGLAALGAAVAALVSLAKNIAFKPSGNGAYDITERVAWTFIAAAIASVPVERVAQGIAGANLHTLESIGVAALGAGLTAVLSLAKNTSQA